MQENGFADPYVIDVKMTISSHSQSEMLISIGIWYK